MLTLLLERSSSHSLLLSIVVDTTITIFNALLYSALGLNQNIFSTVEPQSYKP